MHIFRKPATRTKFTTLSIRVRDGASICKPRLATSSIVPYTREEGTLRYKYLPMAIYAFNLITFGPKLAGCHAGDVPQSL